MSKFVRNFSAIAKGEKHQIQNYVTKDLVEDDFYIDPNSEDYMHRNYDNLTEGDKQHMSIDEVLSYYLFKVSQKVKKDFYVNMLKSFILPFRECVNKYGWEKKAQEITNQTQNEDESQIVKSASEIVQEKARQLAETHNNVEFS